MRISSYQLYSSSVGGMLDQQSQVSKLQQQLSTGKRIVQASDDPIGAMQSQALTKTISQYDQYSRNMTAAQNSLKLEEGTLSSTVDNLQNIRDLVVQASNGTQTDKTRAAIATAIRGNLDGLMQLANTQDSAGNYIFSGSKTNTAAYTKDVTGNYVYQGNASQLQINIGPSRSVSAGDPGSSIFGNGATSIMSMVASIATALEQPQTAASLPAFNAQLAAGLGQLDGALSKVGDAQSAVGSRQNVVDQQGNINADTSVQFKAMLSQTQDLDYADAMTQYNLHMTSLQAAQQAYTKVQGLSLFNYMQ